MSLRFTRPRSADLRLLARRAAADPLTYAPVGISTAGAPPGGYRLDTWSCALGREAGAFERAAEALRTWRVHTGAGLIVEADGPPAVGLVVAMAAPLPVGFVEVVCRVVAVVDEPDRAGFSYGTLAVHPERGEESFLVSRSGAGEVTFEIRAAARPQHLLARAFPPITRRLQAVATGRYLEAMRAAVD